MAGLFGARRILGGLAFVCINRAGPGVIHHLDHGLIRLGEFLGGPSPRAQRIADMFNASRVPCEVVSDLRWGRWSKLVWNIPFNVLGAVLNLTTDRLIADAAGVQLVSAIMREVIDAALALGLRMPPDAIHQMLEKTRTMGAYRSSMQVDRQEGRPLEIEAILGEPLRRAQAHGVPTPRLQALYEMARLLQTTQVRTSCSPDS